MRTFTTPPNSAAITLCVTLAVGTIDVHVEHRANAEITLEPETAGDDVAVKLITEASFDSTNDHHTVHVPDPPQPPRHLGSGRVIQTAGSINIINGQVIGSVITGTDVGAVRLTARIPERSTLDIRTITADTVAIGPLHEVRHHCVSGDLDVTMADTVRATGTSGDVRLDHTHNATVQTVSGDVDIDNLAGRIEVGSVSGDVEVHVRKDSTGHVATVSGDIRVAADTSVRADITTRTVSGRTRLPRVNA